MQPIEQINDLAMAKQVAILLEKENERLHGRLKELVTRLASLEGKDANRQLELELVKLQEQMTLLQRRMFGTSSEKRPGDPSSASTTDTAKAPQRGHGPRPQQQLEIVDVEHSLDEADQICGLCGETLKEWTGQSEDSDEITVVERRFVVHRHRRKKYRCALGCAPITAPGPVKLIPGGRYSLAFAVHLVVQKYLYHLPLDRQVKMYRREGLLVDTQTLWDQTWALAQHLYPSYEALPAHIFKNAAIHADETPWMMLDKGPGKKWQAWCLAAHDAVYYEILPSRSGATALDLLDGYQGIAVVDGLASYRSASRQSRARGHPGFRLANCWAHVRRKFDEAEKFAPSCSEVIDLIGKLYAIERTLPSPHGLEGDELVRVLAQRLRTRREQSAPIVVEIRRWALAQQSLPESTFRKAIQYMLRHWPGLLVFLKEPWVPIDNNLVERELRDVVMGRKNHLGSKSERGTKAAALFYSLIDTAKLRGVDPVAYLQAAALAAIAEPGAVTLPALPSSPAP